MSNLMVTSMQLFSYISNGQIRSAKLINDTGIDLSFAYQYFIDQNKNVDSMPIDFPSTIVDLLNTGQDGIQKVILSTDWIMEALPSLEEEYKKEGVVFAFSNTKLAAPIPHPGKIICIAGNFPAEIGVQKPGCPTVFLKPSGGVIGHLDSIVMPKIVENLAYEVELAIVIGKRGRNLPPDKAHSVIFGFTVANDLGDRVLEKRTSQWTSGKMFDTFTPLGPVISLASDRLDCNNLEMLTRVNGQVVQQGNTSQMYFGISDLVSYLSTLTTLNPGDVILTGSPKTMDGKPNPMVQVKPGDIIEVYIDQLGTLTNTVIAESENV